MSPPSGPRYFTTYYLLLTAYYYYLLPTTTTYYLLFTTYYLTQHGASPHRLSLAKNRLVVNDESFAAAGGAGTSGLRTIAKGQVAKVGLHTCPWAVVPPS
eukprot:scaffold9640_cov63-Phaeocystis_antarctica.AAC.2